MTEINLKNLFERYQQLKMEGKTDELIKFAKEIISKKPRDPNVRSMAASIFIDAGDDTKNLKLVNRGIRLIENLLKELSNKEISMINMLEYNLSNAFAARFSIFIKNGKEKEAGDSIQKQKSLLQGLLLKKNKIRKDLLTSIITNYANLLDHLGRTIESIDQYSDCLSIQPNHAVAMGNCANAIKRLFYVSEEHRIRNLYEAWKFLKKACNMSDEVIKIAGHLALKGLINSLEDLEKSIPRLVEGGIEALEEWSVHRLEIHGYPKAPKWLYKINSDRLLLTINQFPLFSLDECKDDIFFHRLIEENKDFENSRFKLISNSINSIKEDYVTARYLYYYFLKESISLQSNCLISSYADAGDYEKFGLSSGILKASFRLAVDCLDKIALSINYYLCLGQPINRINFNNVWFENINPKKDVHPIISKYLTENEFLRALKDLQSDWFLQKFPGPLKSTRDLATHRQLILYLIKPIANSKDYLWTLEEFRESTFFILRLTKAAVLYLICLIISEENKKTSLDGLKSIELPFRLGPGLTKQDII